MSSPREREKRDRRESRGDEREGPLVPEKKSKTDSEDGRPGSHLGCLICTMGIYLLV